MNSSDYYEKFDKQIDVLFDDEKFSEAIALCEQALVEFPNQYFHITNWIMLCYRGMKRFDKCLEIIQQGNGKGHSFSVQWKSWDPIRDIEGSVEILAENEHLLQEAQRNAKVRYEIHLPENYSDQKSYPLFLTMHCDSGILGNIEHHRRNWQPEIMLKHGFIVAYVQSSQALSSAGYQWSADANARRQNIKQCYDELKKEYKIDPEIVLISGFSGGALAALDAAINNIIPVKGFIAIGPDKPEDFSLEKCEDAAKQKIRGIIMEGELSDGLTTAEEMVSICNQAGLASELYICQGIDHWYPKDLQAKLDKAIAFILER